MEDYVSAHLQWISNNPKFVPREQSSFQYGYTYYEMMKELYSTQRKFEGIQQYARTCYVLDKAWLIQQSAITKAIDKEVHKLQPTINNEWFVTIGFNHQTWSVKDCVKCIENILSMDWIVRAKANFELYRENGEHPHCHFIIETKEPKSSIVYKLFRPQYVKKICLSKNFIDVKPMEQRHIKYINLDKASEKMVYVEKDIQFRKMNNIPDFEKNWKN